MGTETTQDEFHNVDPTVGHTSLWWNWWSEACIRSILPDNLMAWIHINGYRFHTKEKDRKSAAQNSGVWYEGIDEATGETKTYYGHIEEIWELDYGGELQIPIFRCQWVKPKAIIVDEYGLTTMELQSVNYKDDQWVLANRVAQVAYYAKPKDPKRHVVV